MGRPTQGFSCVVRVEGDRTYRPVETNPIKRMLRWLSGKAGRTRTHVLFIAPDYSTRPCLLIACRTIAPAATGQDPLDLIRGRWGGSTDAVRHAKGCLSPTRVNSVPLRVTDHGSCKFPDQQVIGGIFQRPHERPRVWTGNHATRIIFVFFLLANGTS